MIQNKTLHGNMHSDAVTWKFYSHYSHHIKPMGCSKDFSLHGSACRHKFFILNIFDFVQQKIFQGSLHVHYKISLLQKWVERQKFSFPVWLLLLIVVAPHAGIRLSFTMPAPSSHIHSLCYRGRTRCLWLLFMVILLEAELI